MPWKAINYQALAITKKWFIGPSHEGLGLRQPIAGHMGLGQTVYNPRNGKTDP